MPDFLLQNQFKSTLQVYTKEELAKTWLMSTTKKPDWSDLLLTDLGSLFFTLLDSYRIYVTDKTAYPYQIDLFFPGEVACRDATLRIKRALLDVWKASVDHADIVISHHQKFEASWIPQVERSYQAFRYGKPLDGFEALCDQIFSIDGVISLSILPNRKMQVEVTPLHQNKLDEAIKVLESFKPTD